MTWALVYARSGANRPQVSLRNRTQLVSGKSLAVLLCESVRLSASLGIVRENARAFPRRQSKSAAGSNFKSGAIRRRPEQQTFEVRAEFAFCRVVRRRQGKVVIDARSRPGKPHTSYDQVASVLVMLRDSVSKVK
jgi:hypothetical protein